MFWKFHCLVREISAHIDNKTQENWKLKVNSNFVAGFAPIVTDLGESRNFYKELLGVPLEYEEASDYTATNEMEGLKHFGLWTLLDAARSVLDQGSGRPMFRFLKEQSNSMSRMWLKRFPK